MAEPALREIQRTEVNGIPAFWAEGPPPLSASLVFRAGRSDETLPSAGITHLVEHLAMFSVGPTRFQVGGMVNGTRTVFYASGMEDEVTGFLRDVTHALINLPLDRLELEKQVLLTEAASWSPGPWGNLIALRFGASGHGLLGHYEFGLHRVSADEVGVWANGYFTRANAALWMTGPIPPGLGLELPPGERHLPATPRQIPKLVLPAYIREGQGAVALSFLGKHSVALTAALSIATDAAHRRLRLESGMSYAVAGGYEPLTAEDVHMIVSADCLDDHARAVQDDLIGLFERLASDGPTQEELARSVETGKRAITDPLNLMNHLDSDATGELFGARFYSSEELIAELDGLTEKAISEAVETILPTALVLTPEVASAPQGSYTPYGWTDTPLEGRRHRMERGRPWRKVDEVIVSPEGISLLAKTGEVVTIRFDECVAVLRFGTSRLVLFRSDGRWIHLDGQILENQKAIFNVIERRIPADSFVPMPED